MTTALFWNLNNKKLLNEIKSLCDEHMVDVIILAECSFKETELQQVLNHERAGAIFLAPFNPSSRLKFLTRYPLNSLSLVHDSSYLSIRRITPPIGLDFLLVATHLSSKLHMTDSDQTQAAIRIIREIERAEERIGHDRTLLIGDLNMNPFEDGVIGAETLHAIMDKNIALKKFRTVQGIPKKMFYNPMWSRLGDNSPGPPGTYFKNKSGYINFYWHTFDQVLIRPDLIKFYKDENLQVITECNGQSLLDRDRINLLYSDHLPIVIKLKTEQEVMYE